jgi:hypothetical protein
LTVLNQERSKNLMVLNHERSENLMVLNQDNGGPRGGRALMVLNQDNGVGEEQELDGSKS